MMRYSPLQRYSAEFIGTAFLLATIVGSGIMAERLSGGNVSSRYSAIQSRPAPFSWC